MKEILFPLSIWLIISITICIICPSHLLAFILAAFGQIALYNMYNQLLEVWARGKAAEIDLQLEQEFSKQGIEVECPCASKAKAYIPVRLDQVNTYKCPKCDKDVKVILQATTAMVTVPLVNTDTQDPNNYKL